MVQNYYYVLRQWKLYNLIQNQQIYEASPLSWTLQWRHNECDCISNHQRLHCLLNCWFKRRSTKILKLRATRLFVENSPVTCEFPAQRASNAEHVSIWWRHHEPINFNSLRPADAYTRHKTGDLSTGAQMVINYSFVQAKGWRRQEHQGPVSI